MGPADTPAQDLHAGAPLLSHKPAVRQIHLHKTCTEELLSYLTNLRSGRYTCTRPARRNFSPISQTCSPADTPAQDLRAGAPLLSHKPAVRQIHLHKTCTQELLSYLTNLQSGRYTCTRPARRSSSPISQTCSPADTPAQDLHGGAPPLSHKPARFWKRVARSSGSLKHPYKERLFSSPQDYRWTAIFVTTGLQMDGHFRHHRTTDGRPFSSLQDYRWTAIFFTTGLQMDGHFLHYRTTDGRPFSSLQDYRWTVIFFTTGLQMDGHFRYHRTTDGRSFSLPQGYRRKTPL